MKYIPCNVPLDEEFKHIIGTDSKKVLSADEKRLLSGVKNIKLNLARHKSRKIKK